MNFSQFGGYPPPPNPNSNQSYLNQPLLNQPTGYQQPLQTGYLQPQRTGWQSQGNLSPNPNQSFLQPQRTGWQSSNALSPSLQPQPTGFQSPLNFQPTGFPSQGLGVQPTGLPNPQLQMMTQSFLPANPQQPYLPSGAMNFNNAPQQNMGMSLQQSFQQAPTPPKIPWQLSREEKRNYDQIFRAWDTSSTGFISGESAREVFGQSGLPSDELMMIWNLADVDNRGQLNLPEFHVAMALIYRRLNGNPIPDELPDELVPPSSKDLNLQVDILKDILKNDNHQRVTNQATSVPSPKNDASVYKHDDSSAALGYKSSSRHLDRKAVRFGENDAQSDLDEMKRQLSNTSKMLDKATTLSGNRTEEDDILEQDMDDLKYRIRRVQDDIDYVSSGRPTYEKDQERRHLERELLYLMHERLPQLEDKMRKADERKKQTEREATRYRDYKNDRYRRYRDEDDYRRPRSRSSSRERYKSRYDDYEPEPRGYMRGTYSDKPAPESERGYERERSISMDRTPPPPPPPAPSSRVETSTKTPPPPPTTSPAPGLKSMSAEERKAYIQSEAQRRVQERLKALGVSSSEPDQSTSQDTVSERLEKDKKEAEEKAKKEDEARRIREEERQKRSDEEKSKRTGATPSPTPTPAPVSNVPKKGPPPPVPTRRGPPAPPVQPPQPPPSQSTQHSQPTQIPQPPQPPQISQRQVAQVDPEEEIHLKAIEERKAQRAARMAALEEEERQLAEAEARFKDRKAAFQSTNEQQSKSPSVPVPAQVPRAEPVSPSVPIPQAPPAPQVPRAEPVSPSVPIPQAPPAPQVPRAEPVSPSVPIPQAPPAPQVPRAVPTPSPAPISQSQPQVLPPVPKVETTPSPSANQPPIKEPSPQPAPPSQSVPVPSQPSYSTNPFMRLQQDGGNTRNIDSSGPNPFFQQQQSPSNLPPPVRKPEPEEPPKAPSPIAPIPTVPSTLTRDDDDDDWDNAKEISDEDSSDDEFSSRDRRDNLAKVLFGGMMPSSNSNTPPKSPSGESPTGPPPPPPPAPAPSSQPKVAPTPVSTGPADRSGLLSQIRGGASLKKAQTNDRSKPASSGGVIGDSAPPDHISDQPKDHSSSKVDNRQSVDWIGGLASEEGKKPESLLPSVSEDQEDSEYVKVPSITVDKVEESPIVESHNDPLDEFDLQKTIRTRSLYAYEAQRDEDLPFVENIIIEAHPAKDESSPWWYGKLSVTDKSGWFPKDYVKPLEDKKAAKALYDYTANGSDEFSIVVDETVFVIDTEDADWWKVERDGLIGNIPAAYVQLLDDSSYSTNTNDDDGDSGSESEDESEEDEERRAIERERVFEAAGLILKPISPVPGTRKVGTKALPSLPIPRPSSLFESVPKAIEKDNNNVKGRQRSKSLLNLPDAYDKYAEYLNNHNGNVHSCFSNEMNRSSSSIDNVSQSSSTNISQNHSSGLLNSFIGRMRSSSSSSQLVDRTSLISGPISKANNEETSSTFGKTWASLIDDEALKSMSDHERKRQEAIFELIMSEKSYVGDLTAIIEVYLANLIGKLNDQTLSIIFSNVEDIILINTAFLSDLEELQKQYRLYILNIGDVLLKHLSNIEECYKFFCLNQDKSLKTLMNLRENDETFDQHLKHLKVDNPTSRNLDLNSHLLSPMQRITRYPLLIQQIVKYTPDDKQDEYMKLNECLNKVEKILNDINENKRLKESDERLKAISNSLWIGQNRLDLTAPTKFIGKRLLIKEGQLVKYKSGRKLNCYVCNDIVILVNASEQTLYRIPTPLNEINVDIYKSKKDDTVFQIETAYPRNGEKIILRTHSSTERNQWISTLTHVKNDYIKILEHRK